LIQFRIDNSSPKLTDFMAFLTFWLSGFDSLAMAKPGLSD